MPPTPCTPAGAKMVMELVALVLEAEGAEEEGEEGGEEEAVEGGLVVQRRRKTLRGGRM